MRFSQSIRIGSREVGQHSPAFIIAEAGVNHGGNMDLARRMIDVAVQAGADAVKFQAFRTSSLIVENVEKAPYQVRTTGGNESQADMLRKLELRVSDYVELKAYCEKKGIIFLITPFDETSLEELCRIGLEAFKIASTDATNLPFLRKLARTGKPLILSTGMCYLAEVRKALEEIQPLNEDVVLLQCTANYPIRDDEANIRVLDTYRKEFGILVGYSDHSLGIGAGPYTVPLGAKVMEKHFTLDKAMVGPDHSASLSPEELAIYVREIRKAESYMGTGRKELSDSEKQTRISLQKCFVAKTPIKPGDTLGEFNLVAKRTGGRGISPIEYRRLEGCKASRAYAIDEVIEEVLPG